MTIPDPHVLDRLDDRAMFVLRAVVQLSPADREELRRATRLPEALIGDAIRYGLRQGVLEAAGELIDVAPAWHRTLTRALERRHMVVR